MLRPGDPNYRLADLETPMEIAAVTDGVELPLLDRWTYALCPVDVRDAGIDRLLRWGLEHAAGEKVRVPTAGHLPAPHRADQAALERAEKAAKRLVAWRWLSQHFPDSYADGEFAATERKRLDGFIEGVLQQQAIGRSHRGGPRPPERAAEAGWRRQGTRKEPPPVMSRLLVGAAPGSPLQAMPTPNGSSTDRHGCVNQRGPVSVMVTMSSSRTPNSP